MVRFLRVGFILYKSFYFLCSAQHVDSQNNLLICYNRFVNPGIYYCLH